MNNCLHRLCHTFWRRKLPILVITIVVSFIIYGLQFSKLAQLEFLEKPRKNDGKTASEKPSRTENYEGTYVESDFDLGVSALNYDPTYPYVPKSRLVHLDLKGAPPLPQFYKKFFKMIRIMGATGILIEYEDMFPYGGILRKIRAKNAYTITDIREILKLAQDSKLDVIPLVQTFGHLEFALKHREFAKLREVPSSPQALCPSRNDSLVFIREMVRQVLDLHPNIKYLHIGCDEVYQMGECQQCRLELRDILFLRHVVKVSKAVKELRHNVRLIIWDDMLRHIPPQTMIDLDLGRYVEPMVWVYAEDVYRFVQPAIWEKYSRVFATIWAASAFKGAFGETLIVPDSRRHLENNLKWLEVMSQKERDFKQGFSGIAITGWQRYDHFAVLCELLPAGIPSLALNLLALSNGYFNVRLKPKFLSALSCPRNNPFINLNTDPFLWDRLSRCLFPGNALFKLTYRLRLIEGDLREFIRNVREVKGWMTDYNVRRKYSSNLRIEELTNDLPRFYQDCVSLVRMAADSMRNIYDNHTIYEWIEQKIYPYIEQLETISNASVDLKKITYWESRPLKPLKVLERYLGV